jgi:uncharacterized coiled-coil DUF342 family protein
MIPNEINERRKMIERMVDYCMDKRDELSQWEASFIESINEQFSQRNNLTDRQCEILEKIYDKS